MVISLDSSEIFFEIFAIIEKVVKINNSIFLLINKLNTVQFDHSLDVYEIAIEPSELELIALGSIDFILKNFQTSYIYKYSENKKYINYLHVK